MIGSAHFSHSRLLFVCIIIGATAQIAKAQINWTASGPGISWGTGTDWSNGVGPGTVDVARFTGIGASTSPVVTTNTLDGIRTIGGLDYETSDSHFHVTNLAGFALTVAGDLDSGFDIFANATNYIKGAGTLNVGTLQTIGNVYVGRADIAGAQDSNTLDLSGTTAFNGQLNNLWVGTTSANQMSGQLVLPATNSITANSIRVGYSTGNANTGTNQLMLGSSNTIKAGEFTVGQLSNGTVTLPAGGTLNLGTALSATALTVGRTNTNTTFASTDAMNLSGSTFNATLSSLTVGEKTLGGTGSVTASLIGGNGGAITVGQSGNMANFIVAHVNGGGSATGTVDFSGQTSLTASLNDLYIGEADGGTAAGSVKLAGTNVIDANAIRIGYSTNDPNTSTNLLTLGNSNTITTNEFTVGGQLAGGNVTIPANGSLNLGTAMKSASLTVGQSGISSNFAYNSSMNLSGATFNATLSNLLVGEKTGGGTGSTTGSLIGGNGGAITIGQSGNTANFIVGHVNGGSSSTGTVDFSGQTSLTASLNDLYIGAAEIGTTTGTVKLAGTNVIDANAIRVGYSTNDPNTSTNLLALGNSNTITTNAFTVGGQLAGGNVTIPANGLLNLGTAMKSASLTVGQSGVSSNFTYGSSMNLSGATFNATLSNLLVGEKTFGGTGSTNGSLVGGSGGTIAIGQSGNTANFIVGHVNGGGSSTGTVDFSGQTSLTASLNDLYIGAAEGGTAAGTVKLAGTNTIDANAIRVGYSTNDPNTSTNLLALGNSNTITTNEFTVGGQLAGGNVTIPANGSLNLGTAMKSASLTVGQSGISSNFAYNSSMNLSGATFNATLSNLLVGEKTGGGTGSTNGSLVGGHGGAITIGQSGNTANFIVGHVNGGSSSTGTVDFSGQTSLTASLNDLYIGAAEVGTAAGTVKLAGTNVIDANAIRVGYSTNDPNTSTNLLALGNSNTITTNAFTVGGQLAGGNVTIPANGLLNLGTAMKSASLTVGQSGVSSNFTYGSSMNLSGATFNATLSNLLVGEKTFGGTGTTTGSLVGGKGGAITVGQSGNSASLIIGHTSGGGTSSGTVDLSSETSFTANVDKLYVGTSEVGLASGTFKLAATNNISANSIRVGYSTNDANTATSSLVLGKNNTITTNEFTVGGPLAVGIASVTAGGTTNLGSLSQRVELTIGRNDVNTNAASSGIVDFTGTTLNAFLDSTVIGNKSNGGTGTAIGVLTTGTLANIDGHTFTLGIGTGSGTINFNGGILSADSIVKGTATGTAQFNWSAGTLHVGSFGTAAIPFNLVNAGTGVLAPGDDPGLTHIFGNYTQGGTAALQVELGGLTPGTGFDQVVDSANASLSGTLAVSLFGGFQPALNESFVILTANSVLGTFSHVSLPSLPSNLAWQVQYQPTYVSLNVVNAPVPEPATLSLLGSGAVIGVCLAVRSRRDGRRPVQNRSAPPKREIQRSNQC